MPAEAPDYRISNLRLSILYLTKLKKIYAKVYVSIVQGYDEYITSPAIDDIVKDANGNYTIKLRAIGDEPIPNTNYYGSFLVELAPDGNPANPLNNDEIIAILGLTQADSKIIFDVDLYKVFSDSSQNNPEPVTTKSGEISKDSQIEIYE